MEALIRCLDILSEPRHLEHEAASRQFEIWEEESSNELAFALAQVLATSGVHRVALRQLAAIALKNLVKRRGLSDIGSIQKCRHLVLCTLIDEAIMVRAGAASALEALASFDEPWPQLVPGLRALLMNSQNDASVDGALRAIEVLSTENTIAKTINLSTCLEPLTQLFNTHLIASVRARALRCARAAGWLQHRDMKVLDALASIAARDMNEPLVQIEILISLQQLLLYGQPDSQVQLQAVAEYALRSLWSQNHDIALQAAEFWVKLASLRQGFGKTETQKSYHRHYSSNFISAVNAVIISAVPQVGRALLKAIIYPTEDRDEVVEYLRTDLVSTPDPPADIAPHFLGSSSDDDDDDSNDDDQEYFDFTTEFPDHSSRSTWNLRQCAANAIERLSWGTPDSQTQQIIVQMTLSALDQEQNCQWQREATLIALGAIAAGGAGESLCTHAHGILAIISERLSDTELQVRESAAWAAVRCFSELPSEFFSAPALKLASLLTNENCKAVLIQTASAAAAIVQSLDAERPLLLLAQALATGTQRAIATRARFVLLEAIASLAWTCHGQPVPARLNLLMTLDACWQLHDETVLDHRRLTHPHELLPLLQATKALSDGFNEESSYFYKNAMRAATIADIAVEVLEREFSESVDDARAAAQLGAYALDVAAALVGTLPADGVAKIMVSQGSDALARALHVGALNDDAEAAGTSGTKCTVTTLCDPHKRRSKHRANTRRHRLALGSAAAIFLGEIATKMHDSLLVNSEVTAAGKLILDSAPRLLACLDVPLRLASATLTDLNTAVSPSKQKERDLAAAALVSHNACWALGQLLATSPLLTTDKYEMSKFLHTAIDRLCILLQTNSVEVPDALSHHAALVLGGASSSLGESLVLPHLAACLDVWLSALVVAPNHDSDTAELTKAFRAICAIAKQSIELFRPSTSAALLAALASWRHCQPPTPSAELGLELKRLLQELEARGTLHLSSTLKSPATSSSFDLLRPGDFEYLRGLYG